MEFEKALFRIHERILSQDNIQQAIKIMRIGFTILGLFLLTVFLYANSVHRNVEGCIGNIYKDFQKTQLGGGMIANDTVLFINVCSYNKTEQPVPMSFYNYTYYDIIEKNNNQNNNSTALDPKVPDTNDNTEKDKTEEDNEKDKEETDKEKDKDSDKDQDKEKQIEVDVNKKEVKEQQNIGGQSSLPSFIIPMKKQLKSFCTKQPKLQMEQAAVLQSLTYPKEMRLIRNITTAAMYIEPSCYASNYFEEIIIFSILGIEPIVINEIITNFKQADLHIKNIATEETWAWSTNQIFSYEYNELDGWFYKSLISFFRINLGLFYTSAITSLYIKISIICSPVFILLIVYCVRCLGSNDVNVNTVIQTFPYLGLYLHAIRGQKANELVKSFLKMMLVIYFIYLSALFVGSFILFSKSIPKGLDENFLALLAILELLIMLFMRTRSSLKWFPRYSILLMSTFLFYTQNTVYGFYSVFLSSIIFLILGFFCFILEEFEIPAVSWNESYHYTPSTHRPRCLYFPIFNLGWYYDLPQLWTMFYPLYGRDHFTQAQLSLVDSNYILLNQTLENAERGNNNDLGLLLDFPQNNNRNNAAAQAAAAPAANQALAQNENQPIDIENQGNQDIEMQNQNIGGQNIISGGNEIRQPVNQVSQQQTEDFFNSEENQNRSREQHLLANEDRGVFYSGSGVQIGGNVINHNSRQSNENQGMPNNGLGNYQKLE